MSWLKRPLHQHSRRDPPRTVELYGWVVDRYDVGYLDYSDESLASYKRSLMKRYKPKTANLHIQAMNRYLGYLGLHERRMRQIRIQQDAFLDNVISQSDYLHFKSRLKADGRMTYYFAVWFMAGTGARVSELLEFTVQHVRAGYADVYSKGGKMRRLYIPKPMQAEALAWLAGEGRTDGYLFLNQNGQRITANGLGKQLRTCAERYGIDRSLVHPHSFRHLFARQFLSVHEDIALLADLMGHSSIETTRIYLRKTSVEQQSLIDRLVTW